MNFTALRDKAEQAERFLKAMANGHRLMILCELHKGEIAVTPLHQKLKLGQASLSQHLARLRLDGLVKTRRESQTIYYSLASDDVARAIELIYEIFCGGAQQSGRRARPGRKRPRAPRPNKVGQLKDLSRLGPIALRRAGRADLGRVDRTHANDLHDHFLVAGAVPMHAPGRMEHIGAGLQRHGLVEV